MNKFNLRDYWSKHKKDMIRDGLIAAGAIIAIVVCNVATKSIEADADDAGDESFDSAE